MNNNKNMKQCNVCNKEIAKNAKMCPQCGAKNKKTFYKMKRTYVIIIFVFMFFGIFGSSDNNDSNTVSANSNLEVAVDDTLEEISDTQSETQQEQISYTAYDVSQLIDDLRNNALSATEKYKNQYVELTGDLSVIDASGKYITIEPSNDDFSFESIMCDIKNDEQKSIISSLSKGDTIVVKGKITSIGEVLGYSLDIDEIAKKQ